MSLKLTPYRVFSGQAGNGPRRLAIMGTAASLVLVTVAGFALVRTRHKTIASYFRLFGLRV